MSSELFELLGLDPDDPEVAEAREDDANLTNLMHCLYQLRQHRGLSQKDIADRMGTTQSAVSDLERTAVDPRVGTLQRYARAVGAALRLVPVTVSDEWRPAARFRARAQATSTPIHVTHRPRPQLRVVWDGNGEAQSA